LLQFWCDHSLSRHSNKGTRLRDSPDILIAEFAEDWVLTVRGNDALRLDDFDPVSLRHQGRILSERFGRGATYFISPSSNATSISADPVRPWVLRHYRRGGWVAKVTRDWYFATTVAETRAVRELRLLLAMDRLQLPVPRPIGAHVRRRGWWYQADLLMEALVDTTPLADWPIDQWTPRWGWCIGVTLRRFHEHGVYHADLNARNLLLSRDEMVYVIDFDRGERRPRGRWCAGNLQRLRRSLKKLGCDRYPQFTEFWRALLAGYADEDAHLKAPRR